MAAILPVVPARIEVSIFSNSSKPTRQRASKGAFYNRTDNKEPISARYVSWKEGRHDKIEVGEK